MSKQTNFRWVMCAMLFVATTVNYLDRQVLSLTWESFIKPDFHWDDNDYGTITATFSLFYAFISLFAGRFIDHLGTKKGYVWAIIIWSVGACMHAGCGWLTMQANGVSSIESMRMLDKASQVGLMGFTFSVWVFLACRLILAVGESGNFPAAIKVTAEYFPRKDRSLATSIFNAGASVGALVAPLTIPPLAIKLGWEWAFIIIGGMGFIWAGVWLILYDKPRESRYVNDAELAYIKQDIEHIDQAKDDGFVKKDSFSILSCLKYRATWAFVTGKLLTDGVWWFLLFWAPAYFKELGYPVTTTLGQMLVFVLYLIVSCVSIVGGYMPRYFVNQRGMNPFEGRMLAMLLFAFLPVLALFAQPLSGHSPWIPCVLIGLAAAGHQAWSANLYSTIGDKFPKKAIGTITGIGTMFGGFCAFAVNKGGGMLFKYAETQGSAFTFMEETGKQAAYMMVFCYCAVAYLIAWCIIRLLLNKKHV